MAAVVNILRAAVLLGALAAGQDGLEPSQEQHREHTPTYYMFGIQVTLAEMLVVAILIWGTIAFIILYYVDYLKRKWADERRVTLTSDFSSHDTSSSGMDNSATSLYGGMSSSAGVIPNSFNSKLSAKPPPNVPMKGSVLKRRMIEEDDSDVSLRL